MLNIPSISAVVAALGVIVGVVFTVLELRNLVKTRQMGMLMRIYLTWGSEDMKKALGRFMALEIKDYNDFAKKYGLINSPKRSPVWVDIDRIGWFINGIGLLVHRKLADIETVDDLFGYGVINIWERMKPLVEGWRKQLNFPKSFGWFEYLYNELKRREQQLAKIQ